MKKKLNLFILLVFLFIGLMNSKPLPNLNSDKTGNTKNKFNSPKIPDHPKEYYDELVEKGIQLDNLTLGNPHYSFYEKINYKEDKKKRKKILENLQKRRLSDSSTQTLSNLGFVDLYQKNEENKGDNNMVNRGLRYLMNFIKKEESKFILYPYPFEYKDQNNVDKQVEYGGFFALNQSTLDGRNFNYLQNISSVQIGKAKGLYDIDIAILSIVYIYNGRETDLFTEANTFCEYFVNTLTKISSCLDGKNDYLEYKINNPNKGAVVRVSDKDLLNNTLFDSSTGQLKFKLLIISDYLTGNEETILNKYITPEARNIIQQFRELGGHIITSGKSGYLLELMGLIDEGTYDNSFTLGTNKKDSDNKIIGCENIYKSSPNEQDDYLKELICLGYKTRTYLVQTFTIKNIPDNFETLIEYTNSEKTLIKKIDGYETAIENRDIKYPYILISKEESGKGRIMLVNGSPIKNSYYLQNVRNMILYAMTSNIIYDLKIKFNPNNSEKEEDIPIPAGEEGVQLVVSFKLYNLASVDMSNVEINILIANKVDIITTFNDGDNCKIENDAITYKDYNLTDFDKTKYIKCSINSLTKLNSYSREFKLEITDYKITAKSNDIPLMYSKIKYKDLEFNKDIISTPGIFYTQALVAALLRGTINKDPSSTYPLEGFGRYFDLVLNIENKEETIAKDVNYISLIPLVTPLFDGEDEGSVAKVVPLYDNYYETHNYTFPWTTVDNRGVDYIDYIEIAGKGICYVDDFDTPVKMAKVPRDSVSGIDNLYVPKEEDSGPDDYAGQDKATNANSLLKQIYFGDNEKFYETAAPRVSLFVNTATEKGAKALFGDTIPTELKDPHNGQRTKVQYAFVRVHTYFYNSEFGQYQLPDGFNDKILISIDKFDQTKLGEKKGNSLSDIKREVVNEGYYDSTKEKLKKLKPHEYSNSLRRLTFMKQYDPTDSDQLKQLQNLTNTNIYLSHFMVPINDKNGITNADSIIGFEIDTNKDDGSGYLSQYSSVKFVKGHSIELILKPEITRLGGKVEFTLPSEVLFSVEDPVQGEESITTSADNVAFYKTEYNKVSKVITIYFKRGLMPNENYGQPSKCKVFLENLNKKEDFEINLKIYNLKYDFSIESLESYEVKETSTLTASYMPFFSLPCLYMENKLTRKNSFSDEEFHDMYEYELMNPFARYGGYFQELTKHTAVYASAEAHHVRSPGFQSTSSGFALLANIGTSAIPFAEFLEHGKLAVPGVVSTSRLEWTDIWGRKWAQNLRSVYPDIPVIPPAPLSYIMTTTYELITNDKENKQERVLEWQSDESVYIRIQMKVRNTYHLYWEPTICKGNQIPIMKESYSDYKNPIFIDFDKQEDISSLDDTYDINLGFSPQYGVCYDTNSYIGGVKVDEGIVETIKEMTTCSNTLNAEEMTRCSKEFDQKYKDQYPIVKKRPDEITDDNDPTPNKNWNYSPLIENYLPEGYINTNQMWQLTLSDYSDDSLYKGYPYHLDNCIPNLDNEVHKPQDLIAFPIYKGLGYNITYSRDYSLKKFKEYKGWWSDQLQNKDHSLIAGQQKVNQVSVGEKSLIKDSEWINVKDLKNTKNANLPKNRLKNIYVCKYNQNRVKIRPGQDKYSFLKNVYQNNVVPVLPDLKEDDDRYTNFECTGENSYQYTIYNISEVDNRVYTGNDRDWLYFAVGLRSNARENINVILKMDPIDGSKFEGITKIQDGGRFTYWEPPDGPNSYQYYDGNVNTVISKRIDLSMTHRLIPIELYTFNTYAFQLFSIADKKELNREYTLNTYMNSHGYGDATTTVYVGGTDNTKCKLNPGEYTYVKISFYNNAGFSWKMKDNAITMNYEGYSAALNANSIMAGQVTAIQYPKEYNFMSYDIPKEIKDFVTLIPSQHLKDISPQFFDLTFNNVLEIKDALEGDYYYVLTVKDNFPEIYKGKLWEIKMILNEEYFETLPGVKDPTDINKVHDYHLTIPSIKFGVPLSTGPYKGKVFYNLGQAKDLSFTYKIHKNFEFRGIKLVKDEDIDALSNAVVDEQNKFNNLLNIWDSINNNPELSNKIKVTNKTYDEFYQLVTVNLSEAYPLFPYEVQQKPFVTNISLLVKTFADYVPSGYRNHLIQSRVNYNDGRKIKKTDADSPLYINCKASGPSLTASFNYKIVELNETTSTFYEANSQKIFKGDTKFVKLTISIMNEGTATAYNPKFYLGVDTKAVYIDNKITGNSLSYIDEGIQNNIRKIKVNYDRQISQGENLKFDLYFETQFGEKMEVQLDNSPEGNRNLEENSQEKITLVKGLNITLCLSDAQCKENDPNYGIERTDASYKIGYTNEQRAIGRISLKAENIGTDLMPKIVLTAEITGINGNVDLSTVEYSFKRKIEGRDERFKEIELTYNNTIIDIPFKEGEIKEDTPYKLLYKVIGEFPDGRTLDSINDNEKIFVYVIEENGEEEEILDKKEEEKGSIPIYVIVIIVVACLGVLVCGAFLIYKFLLKKKNNIVEENDLESIKKSQISESGMKSKSSKRGISNKKVKVISFEENK